MVTARVNDHGYHEFPGLFDGFREFSVASKDIYESSQWQDRKLAAACGRDGTKNPIRELVPGLPWRDPSNYSRIVWSHARSQGIWSRSDEGRFERIGRVPLDDWNKWVLNPPSFDQYELYWADYLESEAIAKATAKMKDNVANWAQNFATVQQTYSSLVKASCFLLDALRTVRDRRFERLRSYFKLSNGSVVAKDGANVFLQWKYGWLTMANDIYGTAKLLQQSMPKPHIATGKAKSFKEEISPISSSQFERTGSGWRQAWCKLYAYESDPMQHRSDQLGLSVNPASLAWELVPYSFVVDWFVPIGSVLDALARPAGYTFAGGSTSIRGELDITNHELPQSDWNEESPRTTHITASGLRRKAYADWPKPGFYAVNPFSDSHSKSLGQRGASSFAMLIQRLR